jgi:hypothetical protein
LAAAPLPRRGVAARFLGLVALLPDATALLPDEALFCFPACAGFPRSGGGFASTGFRRSGGGFASTAFPRSGGGFASTGAVRRQAKAASEMATMACLLRARESWGGKLVSTSVLSAGRKAFSAVEASLLDT